MPRPYKGAVYGRHAEALTTADKGAVYGRHAEAMTTADKGPV